MDKALKVACESRRARGSELSGHVVRLCGACRAERRACGVYIARCEICFPDGRLQLRRAFGAGDFGLGEFVNHLLVPAELHERMCQRRRYLFGWIIELLRLA